MDTCTIFEQINSAIHIDHIPGNGIIVQMLVNEIARLSNKLTDDERNRLITIGALVHQQGSKNTMRF